MNDGLDIPVHTPGAPAAASALERVAEASDRIGTSAERSAVGTARLSQTFDALGRAANTFNEIHTSLSALAGMVDSAVNRVSALASEEQALQEMSARLGLDFDRAGSAAGRFADETTAMGVAGRAAASDIRLTQTELDAVMRLSGAKARELGTTVQGAAEMLTDALVRGREGGLQRFGQGLSELAGEGHTVQERLAGVVAEASRTAAATDSAADAVERYKDSLEDAQRTAATAFVTELARIQAFSSATRGATSDADDLKVKMQAVGSTAAYILTQVGNVAQVVAGVIGVAMAPLLTGLDVAAAGIAALSSDGPAAAARAMAAAAQEGRASQALRFAGDGLRGFRDAYNASNTERTTAAPEAAAATAGGGTGRGSDMTFGTDEATQILGRNRRRGGSRGETMFQQTDETRRASALALAEKERAEGLRYLEEQHRLAASTAAVIAADVARVRAEQTAANDNARGKGAEQSRLNRLAEERSNSSRIRSFFAEQANAAVDLRKTVEDAYGAMTGAAGAHFEALVTGQETAGAALQGFVHDTLSAWAKIAAQRAVIELGAGFASLFTNPAAAPAHFTAAALYGVAAAATGGLAAATAPAAASGSARASSGGESQRAASVSPQRRDNGSGGGTVINVNFGGSTIIGAGGSRQAAREIANVLNEGNRQGGVTLSPRVMGAR